MVVAVGFHHVPQNVSQSAESELNPEDQT